MIKSKQYDNKIKITHFSSMLQEDFILGRNNKFILMTLLIP